MRLERWGVTLTDDDQSYCVLYRVHRLLHSEPAAADRTLSGARQGQLALTRPTSHEDRRGRRRAARRASDRCGDAAPDRGVRLARCTELVRGARLRRYERLGLQGLARTPLCGYAH